VATSTTPLGVDFRCEVKFAVVNRRTCWDCVHGFQVGGVFCAISAEMVLDEITDALTCDFYDPERE
jgi:hypothetical protein